MSATDSVNGTVDSRAPRIRSSYRIDDEAVARRAGDATRDARMGKRTGTNEGFPYPVCTWILVLRIGNVTLGFTPRDSRAGAGFLFLPDAALSTIYARVECFFNFM